MSDDVADVDVASSTASRGLSFLGTAMVSAVVCALMLGGLGYYALQHRDRLTASLTAAPATDTTALEQQLTAQQAEIATLKKALKALSGKQSQAAPIDAQRLSDLEASLAQMKQAMASPEQLQQMQEQVNRLSAISQSLGQQITLQQEEASRSLPDLRLLASFQSLRARALEGQSFQESLQRFLALTPAQPDIHKTARKLELYASSGRPLLEDLKLSFSAALKDYLKGRDGVDNSLSGKVKRNLAQFITVRKTTTAGNTSMASINRAQAAISEGKIARAIEELNDLPKDDLSWFAAWQEEASAYETIPDLLMKIDRQLAELLMAPDSTAHAS